MTALQAENTALLLTAEYGARYATIESLTSDSVDRFAVVTKLPGNPEIRLTSVRQFERYINGH